MERQTSDHHVAIVAARISGGMTIAVGAVHVAFTARDFDHPSLDALWFAGSGLSP